MKATRYDPKVGLVELSLSVLPGNCNYNIDSKERRTLE
jgi:hypothetical protein